MMYNSMNLNAVQAFFQFNFSEIRKNWYAVQIISVEKLTIVFQAIGNLLHFIQSTFQSTEFFRDKSLGK